MRAGMPARTGWMLAFAGGLVVLMAACLAIIRVRPTWTVWVLVLFVNVAGIALNAYHLIVGAKGGKLQLVLNTVYHLSQPIENVHWYYYKEFVQPEGRFRKYTEVAIPYCLGDSYSTENQRFRIVGTIPELFDKLAYGTDKKYKFREGRNFRRENFFEAVIGSVVAHHSGLKVGSKFLASHGLSGEDPEEHEHDAFEVVGGPRPFENQEIARLKVTVQEPTSLLNRGEQLHAGALARGLRQEFEQAAIRAAPEGLRPLSHEHQEIDDGDGRGCEGRVDRP